jgi:YVTN family beta-propeller protein
MRRVVAGVLATAFVLALTTSAVLAAGPVDVRGNWDGFAVANIGSFHNTLAITSEDFSTGAISGTANAATYTVTGSVSGNTVKFDSVTAGYTSHSTGVVSPDGKVLSGTFKDTNGRSGTFSFSRTTPVPSPSATASTAPSPSPSPSTPAATSCTFGGFGGGPAPIAASTDPVIVDRVGGTVDTMPSPGGIVVDSTDPRGRVFVTNLTAGTLSVIDGRPLDPSTIHVETRIPVGGFPSDVALDPGTGHVFVSLTADCRVAEVDGRARTPVLLRTTDVPGNPSLMVFDPKSGRLFVAIQGAAELLVLSADLTIETTITLPGSVSALALDAAREVVYAGATTTNAAGSPGGGSVSVIDASASTPAIIGGSLPASGPTAIVPDPASGAVLVVEDGARSISTISVGPGDVLKQTSSSPIDPDPTGAAGPAGRGGASTAVLLPGRHALLVPLRDRAAALVYDIAANGTLRLAADLEGVRGGSAAALDPVTGRAFVSEVSADELAVLLLDAPVAAAPSITDAVPGPFDVSLAPADVARSIGITMLLMLLLGAPTPIFNRTLSANRTLIERWVRRRRPKWMRGRRHLAGAGTRVKALSTTRAGLLAYLGLATLLYSFLEPTFPFRNGLETFGTTLFGIAVGTAVSQVPGELYVRRHYGQGGKVKVALWTLGLAAACVLITRVTAVEPGYVYGIIGGFTFAVVLSADDRGRMAFRGVTILLAVGFVAWFVRVPFQPGGPIAGDGAVVANRLLARMFVTAVEGCAIGLIPLRYLEGEELFSWNRARWAVVWAMSLLLFAHVILYPVSSYEPNPSPTGLWTIALTVFVYSTLAIGFWWFFRQREVRRRRRLSPS